MKKITVLLFAIVLGSSQIFASNNNPVNAEQLLRNEIASLLDHPKIKVEKEELSANIEFTLNSRDEIVVLTVDSEQDIVIEYVKSRLNYKKIDSEIKAGNKVFKIALKIIRPQGV